MLEITKPQIAVELIGGINTPLEFVQTAIKQKTHIVTANKALLAEHGNNLAKLSEQQNITIAYEAAIGGGIPIVKAIREAATAADISSISGILNGTCNFILSQMTKYKSDFIKTLEQAQNLGYAEADPSFDIGGIDAAHKIAILTALAYGQKIDLPSIEIQGIKHITQKDIAYAKELGYCIKLLAQAEKLQGGIRQSVAMRMLPMNHALAHVEDCFNGIDYRDEMNERITLIGHGAGGDATASAVIADIIDIAKGARYPLLGLPFNKLKTPQNVTSFNTQAAYYIRLDVKDAVGVLSSISDSFFKHNISVESVIQHGRDPNMPVSMVFITHLCLADNLHTSLIEVNGFDFMLGRACVIEINSN